MNFLTLNMKYITAFNTCDRRNIMPLFDMIVDLEGGFTKKRYVWNVIRGRSFYRDIVFYLTTLMKDVLEGKVDDQESAMFKIESVINNVLQSEKNFKVRQSFVWNLTKGFPVLTAEILPYMSIERIKNILNGDKVLTDCCLGPFIETILELKEKNQKLTDLVAAFTDGDGV